MLLLYFCKFKSKREKLTFFLFGFTGTLSSFQKDNKSICLLVQIELISPLISSLVRGKDTVYTSPPLSLFFFFEVQVYRVHGFFFISRIYAHIQGISTDFIL